MRALPCVLSLMVLAAPGPAAAATAMGIGTRDCTAFLRATEIDSEQALDAYVAWGLGYLTGRNASVTHGRQVVVDGGSLVHWLGAWCAEHREVPIFEAMESFARQSGG